MSFGCGVCDKKFARKDTLERHVRENHEDPVSFKCGLCKRKFTRPSTLKLHMRDQHKVGNKKKK
jgi:uncharacterized Zn-finger protein